MTANVDQWIEALERIRALRRRPRRAGPRPGRDLDYLADAAGGAARAGRPRSPIAVAKGWSREETIERVRFEDAFGPVDIGQEYMMDYIQNHNAGSLWDKLTATGYAKGR